MWTSSGWACFGPKWPKTGHFGCRTSCVAGGRVGLPSAVSPCAGTLWWRSIFAQFQFFSFFGFLWPKWGPMLFFFNGIFPILPYLSNLPCCDPEPQTTAKLPPHNVVAQHFGWFCHFCSWARCAGAARRGKRGETAVECAKCPTRQIWGPNQVPCIGRCKAP